MVAFDPSDVRFVRFQHAVVALVILTAYVFRLDVLVPALALVLGVAALAGPRGNLIFFVFDVTLASRIPPSADHEDADATRFSLLVAIAALALASALFAIGLGGIGWIVALALAAAEAVGAAARISIGRMLYERFRSRG